MKLQRLVNLPTKTVALTITSFAGD